jgi:Fe-S-cluster containining protein
MERKGECNHCGWCCQFDGVHRNIVSPPDGVPQLHPSDRKFYELRGGQSPDGGRTIRYLVQAYAPCSAHDKERKRCTIYDDRPLSCTEFPSIPGQIEGTPCSFWFEDVVDGAVVRRGGQGSPHPTPPAFG